MTVVKSQRTEGELTVITKARDLADYTVTICSNEKYFPKRYRWCLTGKIVNSAIEIHMLCLKANAVYVRDDEDYQLRKRYQTMALSETYALEGVMDIAYRTFGVDADRIDTWSRKLHDVQNLIRAWRKKELRGNG